MWPLLDGHASIAELAEELADVFADDAGRIAADVEVLCDRLTDEGFLA